MTTLAEQAAAEAKRQERHDPVNHPLHYEGAIECIDAIEAALGTPELISAYLSGTAFKYLWRFRKKHGVEDLQKCKWYLERLIAHELIENAKGIGPDYEMPFRGGK